MAVTLDPQKSGTDVLLAEMASDPEMSGLMDAVTALLLRAPSRRDLIDVAYQQTQTSLLICNVLIAVASKDGEKTVAAFDELLPHINRQVASLGHMFARTSFEAMNAVMESENGE